MNNEQFKAMLQRDKLFLKSLFESDSISKSKRILNFASDAELTTLSKYIHLVSNGEIKIKKENFNSLEKKHLNIIKKNFEKKANLQKLVTRKSRLLALGKLLGIMNHLLAPLFRE